MANKHVVTALSANHKLVVEEMESPPVGKVLHQLKLTEEQLAFPTKVAWALRDQITSLPLKVGNEVVVITESDQAVIELLAVCFLQRRFNECIKVSVKRDSGEFFIPYVTTLAGRPEDEESGMVDYNYSTGGCSGNCSSCG